MTLLTRLLATFALAGAAVNLDPVAVPDRVTTFESVALTLAVLTVRGMAKHRADRP